MSATNLKKMTNILLLCISILISGQITKNVLAAEIETPEKHFGFKPGTDRMLFTYEELISYLQKLDVKSPRLELREIGLSPLNKKMYIAFFSSEENIKNLDVLKAINKRLALDPNIPEPERKDLIKKGKVFFLATLSMHSGEVGPSQAAPLIAYDLVTTEDQQILKMLDDVVYMMVPCHNPDGMDMIVNHYNKYKGTKYEGSSMPGVYHKYVGHDNNRDFITLSQSDNRAVANIYNKDWFPQVMVEKHQMGSGTARYFVPPMHDPIAENIDAAIWNWTWVFGSNMVTDLTKKGLAGVSQHYLFDDYWPGSTETCIWKNVIGMLTEAASVQYAKPIFVEPNELGAYGKGLSEYKKSINMSLPWEGGWWHLSDIVKYELASTMSIIKTSSLRREDILKFRNDVCKREVLRGKTQPPYYYILPLKQHDKSELVDLINLLRDHGVNVYQLNSSFTLNDRNFQQGDVVVPLAQPFRPFIKEVLEQQQFPERYYTPGGKLIKPYDITSWCLPLHRGVKSIEITNRLKEFESLFKKMKEEFTLTQQAPKNYWAAIFTAQNNESYKAAFFALKQEATVKRLAENTKWNNGLIPKGSFVVNYKSNLKQFLNELKVSPLYLTKPIDLKTTTMAIPRLALVETHFHDMDAGWTRYIFDSYHIPFKVLHPGDFEKSDLTKNFDVIVFPNANKSILMSGKYKSNGKYYITSYPPEYTKGIGKKGMEKVMTFLDKGGIIVSWGGSTELFSGALQIKRSKKEKEDFQLPFRDISANLKKGGLFCPGSLMKINLLKDHPLTLGMQKSVGVFFRGKPVFTTSIPRFDMDRRVIGKFPEKDILLSGYCEKEEKLGNKSAMIWLKKGKGQLVLFGFNPQFRASTNVGFKLLFNSILLPKM
ncbi:hypothetical protein B6I21_06725 [candidate division KSB1 bacterium 4572_119]|nr:MAG: hypothetical protein B6I21_06725 [candidate division KSB1 bacterium 4572_119]